MKIAVTAKSFIQNKVKLNKLQDWAIGIPQIELMVFDDVCFDRDKINSFLMQSQPHVWLLGAEIADAATLKSMDSLNALVKYGVGLDNIDLPHLQERGITLLHRQGVNSKFVAEYVLAAVLSHQRKILAGNAKMKRGVWYKHGGESLFRKTFGIIGFGNVGKALYDMLKPWDCEILVNEIDPEVRQRGGSAQFVELTELLSQSDIVSLHVDLNPSSRLLINEKNVSLMQDHTLLVNCARSAVAPLDLVCSQVKKNLLGGFICDVFDEEPYAKGGEWESDDNIVLTSHCAAGSRQSRDAMADAVIDMIKQLVA